MVADDDVEQAASAGILLVVSPLDVEVAARDRAGREAAVAHEDVAAGEPGQCVVASEADQLIVTRCTRQRVVRRRPRDRGSMAQHSPGGHHRHGEACCEKTARDAPSVWHAFPLRFLEHGAGLRPDPSGGGSFVPAVVRIRFCGSE
jgi:hypothetical protein